MSWRDLLQSPEETLVLPYLRAWGTTAKRGPRSWMLSRPPREDGWYTFKIEGRRASVVGPSESHSSSPISTYKGFLVGDRIVLDTSPKQPLKVHLLEDGLERFCRIEVGRYYENGPIFYLGQDMPCGVEDAVNSAYLDGEVTLTQVKGVPASLHTAFLLEVNRKLEIERRRIEAEARQREIEAQLAREEVARELARQGGSATSRRELAQIDFDAAAKSALAVSGAELIEVRRSNRPDEMIVRFRWLGRRFECVCHRTTLQIIDSGICLTAEYGQDEWVQGTKGDQFFTLESLPGVIKEASDLDKLVVFRHI